MNDAIGTLLDGKLSSLNPNIILSADYAKVYERIKEVIINPQSDVLVSILLFLIVSILVQIVLVAVLMVVISVPDEPESEAMVSSTSVEVAQSYKESPAAISTQYTSDYNYDVKAAPKDARRSIDLFVGIALIIVVWLLLGWSTAQNNVCLSCHRQDAHPTARDNPHADTRCVKCHDSNTGFGVYSLGTLSRSAHLLRAVGVSSFERYGVVSSGSCIACHKSITDFVIRNEVSGVEVSHFEPLETGMHCIDCHVSNRGVIDRSTSGMRNCLPCHNNKQSSADCDTCHKKDVSYAKLVNSSTREYARRIIPVPDCGGCHNMTLECDPCHGGVRMPHSQEFMAIGHAKIAARDYWYGSGSLCVKCHNDERRPCIKCHIAKIGSHGQSFAENHRLADPSGKACESCHDGNTRGVLAGRNFCRDVCHY